MKNSGFSKCWYRCVRFPACDFAWDADRGLPPKPPAGSSRRRRADKDGEDAKKDGKDKDRKEDRDNRPPEADE